MGLLNFFKRKSPFTINNLQNELRILNDCANLIEKTTNPDVFFPRFDLYYEKLSLLAEAQKQKIITVQGDNILEKYSKLNTPEAKVDGINTFIKRYWDSTCSKAENLKTEKGKNNCFDNFKDTLFHYNEQLPDCCIEYYNYLYSNAPRVINIPRSQIPSEQIDAMQRIKASDTYCNMVYGKFYNSYPEMPFISQDREFNTNWIEQAEMFGITPTKEMMERYSDGLLPGHIYMLYWLGKYNKKKIPVYFEYKYGIDFCKEKTFLEENGYLYNGKPTEKGDLAISKHHDIIENHSSKKACLSKDRIKEQILLQKKSLKKNGFKYYEYIASPNSCPTCKAMDGKVFPLSGLTPGVNAPPMCEKCRCSISAYMDDEEYYKWLKSYKEHGLDFEEWKKYKRL